jgi:Xaa-Pro dipeptidase
MRSKSLSHPAEVQYHVQGHGTNKYPAKAHARRVAEAAGRPSAIIGLEGEKTVPYANSDQPRHFRQDRYFYYITGCNEPGCYVTYDVSKDFLTLWLPKSDPRRIFYDGRGSTPEEAMAKYDIDKASYIKPDVDIAWVVKVYGASIKNTLLLDKQTSTHSQPARSNPYVLRHAMDSCRAIKDADEIELIREANRISSEAHRQVLKHLSQFDREAQAEGLFLNTCLVAGAKEQAYGPIVGSGPNAGTLHYQANDELFANREVLLIDASCEYQLYAADITRTMPLNRKKPGYWPSKEAETIYNIVEKVQESCIKMLKPGVRFSDVTWHSIHMTIDALLEIGLLKGKREDILRAGTVGAFFPHGLGHHLGLEVHDITPTSADSEENSSKNDTTDVAYMGNTTLGLPAFTPASFSATPLTPGNVVTIEPGLYFNAYNLDTVYLPDPTHSLHIDTKVLKRYMAVGGVRIEDDILITETGYENLTPAVKGEEMLEVIREGAVAAAAAAEES